MSRAVDVLSEAPSRRVAVRVSEIRKALAAGAAVAAADAPPAEFHVEALACRDEGGPTAFRCSECGLAVPGTPAGRGWKVRFCPGCGAEVEEGGAGC